MSHRLLVFAPLAPAVGVIALALTSAAAGGAGATRVAASPFEETPVENALEDVQVGESGNLMRVALICRTDCRVGARAGGAFFLPEIETALDIDLTKRTKNAEALTFRPVAGGTAMEIRAVSAARRASVKPCLIDGLAASCIDLEFTPPGARVAAGPAPSLSAPRQKPEPEPENSAPASAAPALREAPGEERLVFARFAPPERFDPPAAALLPPEAQSPQQASIVRPQSEQRPIIREDRAARLVGREIDIGREAEAILGKRLGVAECGGAQARLRADAWALDAMVEVGFCEAAAGALDKADGIFARLLAYTPDNYEALVGRALIAARSGERGAARRYFQDALNALPPIEESNRIVEVMARL